jgi:hypothetical protein
VNLYGEEAKPVGFLSRFWDFFISSLWREKVQAFFFIVEYCMDCVTQKNTNIIHFTKPRIKKVFEKYDMNDNAAMIRSLVWH